MVATVSLGKMSHKIKSFITNNFLGVGVDIRVHHAIIFGLSENAEGLLQEGGRPMRGGPVETQNQRGFAFFFHKGVLGKGRGQRKKITRRTTGARGYKF